MSSYKISKPPGYKDVNSDGDSMTPPASPTTDPTNSLKNDNKGNQSSAKDDVDGGGENDDERKIQRAERGDVGIVNGILNDGKEDKINNQLILPVDDVVTDGAGEKNSLPVERKKGVVEKGVQERKGVVMKDAMDGGAQCNKGGVEENGAPPVESQGHLDQRKEKAMTTTHRDVSEENVYGLIDDIEEAITLVSKEEGGATGRLVENVKAILPLVLYMLNEVTTLRGTLNGFILEKRSLQKEVRQLKKEIEERDAKDATIGTTSTVSSSVNPILDGKGTDGSVTTDQTQKQAPGEDDRMKKELKKIRSQNKELQRVNHSWEKYGQNLSAKHQIELKKKSAQLAASDERRKDLEKRLDEKFKEYDQTLIHVRQSEGQQKAAAEQYKKDRDALGKKYGDLTTKLREWIKEKEDKDNEIKRLNKVVERQAAQKPIYANAYAEEELGCTGHTKAARKFPREVVNVTAATLYPNLDDDVVVVIGKEKQVRESTSPRPRSPRSPPRSPPAEPQRNPMTLGKEELKGQMELYRQQIDIFRTDFIQERRDREKAAGQVDTLKKELEKTKKKLEEMQKNRLEHDLYGLGQDFVPRRPREETQKVRGGRNLGYGRQYAYQQQYVDLEDNHVYSVIDN
ncbi:uncharacterized protein LOC105436869 [Strongylocentrotus purpuratus]|uniref:NF-kappa-B essential modulator NEMO CC2-LZ domain-containing protein n=1 Tax=Strongylocentrotus purpuratus TaxID=7668 RepID=A0A7M7SVW0_STRPU|nr:uncharacterized protein LOC105436869 [Strongylocentrotus purpuratus]